MTIFHSAHCRGESCIPQLPTTWLEANTESLKESGDRHPSREETVLLARWLGKIDNPIWMNCAIRQSAGDPHKFRTLQEGITRETARLIEKHTFEVLEMHNNSQAKELRATAESIRRQAISHIKNIDSKAKSHRVITPKLLRSLQRNLLRLGELCQERIRIDNVLKRTYFGREEEYAEGDTAVIRDYQKLSKDADFNRYALVFSRIEPEVARSFWCCC